MDFLSDLQVRTLGVQKVWLRHFDVQAYTEFHPQTINIDIPSEMSGAVSKRKAEFLAGRFVALEALQSAGCYCIELPIGEHRSPVWPKGWRGSISHTDNLALATISSSNEVSFLGLDVENLIKKTQVESLMPMFVSAKEREHMAETNLSLQSFATLVFSAKESIFKAVYPYVRTYLDFSDSMLTGIDMTKREAYFKLCERGEAEFGEALALRVYFLFEESKVYTLVCE